MAPGSGKNAAKNKKKREKEKLKKLAAAKDQECDQSGGTTHVDESERGQDIDK